MTHAFSLRGATLILAVAAAMLSCAAEPAHAASVPSLSKQCKDEGNQFGALLALVQSAKTQAELDVVVNLLARIAETQPTLVDVVLTAHKQGLTPAFVKKAYTEACLAGVI